MHVPWIFFFFEGMFHGWMNHACFISNGLGWAGLYVQGGASIIDLTPEKKTERSSPLDMYAMHA